MRALATNILLFPAILTRDIIIRLIKLRIMALAIILLLIVVMTLHIETSEEELKSRTPRQIFSSWRRSTEAALVLSSMRRDQLGLCPICKSPLGANPHVDHIRPISKLGPKESHLITDSSNLVLLCPKCNLKKKDKLIKLELPGDVPHLSDI